MTLSVCPATNSWQNIDMKWLDSQWTPEINTTGGNDHLRSGLRFINHSNLSSDSKRVKCYYWYYQMQAWLQLSFPVSKHTHAAVMGRFYSGTRSVSKWSDSSTSAVTVFPPYRSMMAHYGAVSGHKSLCFVSAFFC